MMQIIRRKLLDMLTTMRKNSCKYMLIDSFLLVQCPSNLQLVCEEMRDEDVIGRLQVYRFPYSYFTGN